MNRIKIVIAAAAAFFMALSVNAQSHAEVAEKYNKAAELINAKDFQGAISVLQDVIETGLEVGDDALELVAQAQKYLPVSYYQVAMANARNKEYDDAIANFTKAADLGELHRDPSTVTKSNEMIGRVYTILGGEAFNNKDYAKAAEIFAQGYEANPTDTKLALNLAMSYSEMNDLENGSKIYSEIIALGERSNKYKEAADEAREKMTYYVLIAASEQVKANLYDDAIATLEHAIKLDPANPQANMMLLQTANNAKKYDKVIEVGEQAAAAQTTAELQSDAHFLVAIAYHNKQNNAKAIENFHKVTAGNNVATARAQIAELNK